MISVDGNLFHPQVGTLTATVGVTTPFLYAPGGGAITVPTAGDTLVLESAAQTLKNKTIVSSVLQSATLQSPVISGGVVEVTSGQIAYASLYSATMNNCLFINTVAQSCLADKCVWASGIIDGGVLVNCAVRESLLTQCSMENVGIKSSTLSNCVFNDTGIYTSTLFSCWIENSVIRSHAFFSAANSGSVVTLDLNQSDVFYRTITTNVQMTVQNAVAGKVYWLIIKQSSVNAYNTIGWMSNFVCEGGSGIAQGTNKMDVWTLLFDGSRHIAIAKQTGMT